jgi:aromatic ring-opening dioxygenase LigB subunit
MSNIHPFLIPHNPLMISKIGQEHSQKLSSSIKALKDLKKKIYDIDPDKIFIITPPFQDFNNIVINQSEKYLINFKSFGDLAIEFEAPGDLDYSTRLRDFLRGNDFKVNLFSEEIVNSKSFVPFYYLNKYHTSSKGFDNNLDHDPSIKNEFIVINSSQADLNYHWEFGKLFAEFLTDKREEIVVIACGDLLGPVKKNQDEYLQVANQIIDLLKQGQYQEITKLEEELKKGSYSGIKPLMTIAPLISKLKLNPNILSLDKEFGEIYLTTEFK